MQKTGTLTAVYLHPTAKQLYRHHMIIASLAELLDESDDEYAIAKECSELLLDNADRYERYGLLKSEQESLLSLMRPIADEMDSPYAVSLDMDEVAVFYRCYQEFERNHKIITDLGKELANKNQRIAELCYYLDDLALERFDSKTLQ